MFEFTHTNEKVEQPKKEVAGPIAPPTHRTTLFQNEVKAVEKAKEG